MIIILFLSLLFGFDCSASTLPDDHPVIQTSYEDVVEDSSSEDIIESETTEQSTFDDSVVLQNYDVNNLIKFGYIRELPYSVSLADFYILVCRIYNLILMAVWVLIAFDVIDLVARSVGRLKRKN